MNTIAKALIEQTRRTLDELMQAEAKAARPRLRIIEFYRTFLSNLGIRA